MPLLKLEAVLSLCIVSAVEGLVTMNLPIEFSMHHRALGPIASRPSAASESHNEAPMVCFAGTRHPGGTGSSNEELAWQVPSQRGSSAGLRFLPQMQCGVQEIPLGQTGGTRT